MRTNSLARLGGLMIIVYLAGCSLADPAPPVTYGRQTPKPTGFFEKLVDQVTERECMVTGFSCPYGLGPADEPCECVDPSGRVLGGITIK